MEDDAVGVRASAVGTDEGGPGGGAIDVVGEEDAVVDGEIFAAEEGDVVVRVEPAVLLDEGESGRAGADDDDAAFLGRKILSSLDGGEFEVGLFGDGVEARGGEVVGAAVAVRPPSFCPSAWGGRGRRGGCRW